MMGAWMPFLVIAGTGLTVLVLIRRTQNRSPQRRWPTDAGAGGDFAGTSGGSPWSLGDRSSPHASSSASAIDSSGSPIDSSAWDSGGESGWGGDSGGGSDGGGSGD